MGNTCSAEEDQNNQLLDTKRKRSKAKDQKKTNGKKELKSKDKKVKKDRGSRKAKGASLDIEEDTYQFATVEPIMKPDYDESNFKTLLPSEPTLGDANDSEENLDIMLKAREKAVELYKLHEEGEWDLVKDQDDIQLSKGPSATHAILVKRDLIINASLKR
jgi:hypothetical protein